MQRKHDVCAACAHQEHLRKNDMAKRETDYPHTISFRLTNEAWLSIHTEIGGSDQTPHEWCRHAVLEKLNNHYGLAKTERFLFQHLIRAQYLITQGFQMLADHNLTTEEWKKLRANAKHRASELADTALMSYAGKSSRES
jgi:hypothetical protein